MKPSEIFIQKAYSQNLLEIYRNWEKRD